MKNLSIRHANEADVPAILSLIQGIAEYEKLSHEVTATESQVRESLFGVRPYAECLLGCVDGEPVGFLAKPGLYLEDLFVRPEHRGCGLGKALIKAVAKIAVERGCGRYEWTVLDWNQPAIDFYQSLGAEMKSDWRIMRVTGEALEKMAQTHRA
jgi:GNAT superfamily N-acetyltransferase